MTSSPKFQLRFILSQDQLNHDHVTLQFILTLSQAIGEISGESKKRTFLPRKVFHSYAYVTVSSYFQLLIILRNLGMEILPAAKNSVVSDEDLQEISDILGAPDQYFRCKK